MDNENFTPEQNELYNKYDAIVNATLVNLYTLSRTGNGITLADFDLKNKEHLYILRTAIIARDLHDFPLNVQCGLFQWIALNFKIRKLTRKIPRVKNARSTLNPEKILSFMRIPCEKCVGDFFSFGDIYDAFYKGDII